MSELPAAPAGPLSVYLAELTASTLVSPNKKSQSAHFQEKQNKPESIHKSTKESLRGSHTQLNALELKNRTAGQHSPCSIIAAVTWGSGNNTEMIF